MNFPTVTETPVRLEPVVPDTFIEAVDRDKTDEMPAVVWEPPKRRPQDA